MNVRPVAKIGVEKESYNAQGNFEKDRLIYFNASGSYDPNGDKIKSYAWDFGDGNKSTEMHPVHTFTTPSEYTVSLIVTEDTMLPYDSTADQLLIEIPNPPKINSKFNIYHFFFKDPNGYTLEVQKFLD